MSIDLAKIETALRDRSPVQLPPAEVTHWAAVAVILQCRSEGMELLLIRRAQHDGDPWSGHMAFPGGRQDPQDLDLHQTVVRETREEIGWDLSQHGRSLGRLDDARAVARGKRVGMGVASFVFELREERPLLTNYEVDEVIWAPLNSMAEGQVDTTIPYKLDEKTIELPAFDIRGRIVWGLTYLIIKNLLSLTKQ